MTIAISLITIFSNYDLGSAAGLAFRMVRGLHEIDKVVKEIAECLVAGNIVFLQDEAGDPLGTGLIEAANVIRLLDFPVLALGTGIPEEELRARLVLFSSSECEARSHYPPILLHNAVTGDLERLSDLPRDHPYNVLLLVAQNIENPSTADWGPLGPDHEDLDKRASSEAL